MSLHWAGNTLGVPTSEENMRKIPLPKTELTIHVTAKTLQAGALLGTCFAAPIMTLAKGKGPFTPSVSVNVMQRLVCTRSLLLPVDGTSNRTLTLMLMADG